MANKRTDENIQNAVAQFVAEVESFREVEPMPAKAVVNYDETRVFISNENEICVEHASKDRSQRKGPKGETNGLLVSFVAANREVFMSVWIFEAPEVTNPDLSLIHI